MLALLIGAVLILIQGKNPVLAYGFLLQGALGNKGAIAETLVKATPLIFTGLAVTLAYRCGVFNIGAEGQLLLGALGATWAAIYLEVPAFLVLPVSLLAGFLAGGLWGAIPGYLKAKRGLNEIINTILLNYVAIQVVSYFVTGPMKEPPGYFPQSAQVPQAAWLDKILIGTRLHSGLILGLVFAAVVYYFLFHTTYGFSVRLVGTNRDAAEYGGINVPRNFVLAMLLSGGLAGLAGSVEILGVRHRLMNGIASGYGFDGIAVALLGNLHPVGVVIASVFFGVLRTGANTMQRAVGIPASVVGIIQALVIFFVVAAATLKDPSLLRLGRREKGEDKAC
ncbi:MAG: ABC transporter permease [Bacillota bacterium]|nr:MAG: ABC transporter permease [Bacillota bacterium]